MKVCKPFHILNINYVFGTIHFKKSKVFTVSAAAAAIAIFFIVFEKWSFFFIQFASKMPRQNQRKCMHVCS